ncbi:hypothetical protein [Streptomyces sp. NPDC059788]|uniref:hypothetical protein n=1 Tax=Streptomyces sp. NPDC059788 TaxID=3346948 RepID=UPI00365FF8A5
MFADLPVSTHQPQPPGIPASAQAAPQAITSFCDQLRFRRGEVRSFTMREATAGDRRAVEELVTARTEALRRRGVNCVTPTPSALDLIGARDDLGGPMAWVFCQDDTVLGCTAVLDRTAGIGWSAGHRIEPALMLSGLYTHPAPQYSEVGWWITCWLRDYARCRPQVQWLRGTVFSDRLQHRVLAREDGWEAVASSLPHTYLLQSQPRPLPELPVVNRGPGDA